MTLKSIRIFKPILFVEKQWSEKNYTYVMTISSFPFLQQIQVLAMELLE